MQTLASGLFNAHNGIILPFWLIFADCFVLAAIMTLSNPIVSIPIVQSPKILIDEIALITCINSHCVGWRQFVIKVFCGSINQPLDSINGIVNTVALLVPKFDCCFDNNVLILYTNLIPFVTGPIHCAHSISTTWVYYIYLIYIILFITNFYFKIL